MPHASIWFPDEYSNERVQLTMREFADVAKAHKFINRRGPNAGGGNIRELMESIASGETATVLLDDAPRELAIRELRRQAEESDNPRIREVFGDIANALDAARKREEAR